MSSKRQKRSISLALGFALIIIAFVYDHMHAPERHIYIDDAVTQEVAADDVLMPAMPVIISDSRVQHILFGDF